MQVFKKIKEEFPETESIIIYGELYGGHYKHPEIASLKEAIRIQKGIDYCPENDFYAFDIKLNDTHYLDVTTANSFFENTGFFQGRWPKNRIQNW